MSNKLNIMGICHIVILSLSSFVTCEDKHLVCKQVEDIFAPNQDPQTHPTPAITQGRPGERGHPGLKGEPGHVGPPGPPASVNYGRIEATVSERISMDVEALTTKVETLVTRLDDLTETLSVEKEGLCDVMYAGKCFRLILSDNQASYNLQFNAAQEMCENVGWQLANIYDATHYQKIADYMRMRIPSGRTWHGTWIGMTFNPQSRETFYLNGGEADVAGIKGYPGYPSSSSSHTKMTMVIRKDSTNDLQGIHNFSPTSNRHSALCEK